MTLIFFIQPFWRTATEWCQGLSTIHWRLNLIQSTCTVLVSAFHVYLVHSYYPAVTDAYLLVHAHKFKILIFFLIKRNLFTLLIKIQIVTVKVNKSFDCLDVIFNVLTLCMCGSILLCWSIWKLEENLYRTCSYPLMFKSSEYLISVY